MSCSAAFLKKIARGTGIPAAAPVEVTSEADGCSVESAFNFGAGPGWRAALPGKQRVRLVFDQPQSIQRMRLQFNEPEVARTQEFTVLVSLAGLEPATLCLKGKG
jgi:hypothetical protein